MNLIRKHDMIFDKKNTMNQWHICLNNGNQINLLQNEKQGKLDKFPKLEKTFAINFWRWHDWWDMNASINRGHVLCSTNQKESFYEYCRRKCTCRFQLFWRYHSSSSRRYL